MLGEKVTTPARGWAQGEGNYTGGRVASREKSVHRGEEGFREKVISSGGLNRQGEPWSENHGRVFGRRTARSAQNGGGRTKFISKP